MCIYKEPRYNRKNTTGSGGGRFVRGVGWVRSHYYRWCGEVTILGTRYRKRSPDYNTVLFWHEMMVSRKELAYKEAFKRSKSQPVTDGKNERTEKETDEQTLNYVL